MSSSRYLLIGRADPAVSTREDPHEREALSRATTPHDARRTPARTEISDGQYGIQ